MNNSNPYTESSSSPPSSSPVPSPRTDSVQYTACYNTQGDWHNMSCSPNNCTINTISPHTLFSPHQQQPPKLRYIPQFDYQLNPNLSPLLTMTSPYNYPNPNITFYNPYMSRSCKRALNTSGSSVGSRPSPHTKRPRHNTSNCSASTNHSLISNLNNSTQPLLDLDKTWVPNEELEASCSSLEEAFGCSNNNLMCLNCTDMQSVVASCRSCPDKPQLCQLCVEAHKRVRLTRDHKMVMMIEEKSAGIPSSVTDESYRKMSHVMQSLVDLIDSDNELASVNLDDSISSTTAELVRSWSVTSAINGGNKGSIQELKRTQEIIKENLIPIYSHADLDVKSRAAAITKMLIEIKIVNATQFVDDKCVRGFRDMIDCDDTKVIASALDCLEILVKEVGMMKANYSLIQIHSKLKDPLRRLKDREMGVTTSVKFKASRLVREMEKILL